MASEFLQSSFLTRRWRLALRIIFSVCIAATAVALILSLATDGVKLVIGGKKILRITSYGNPLLFLVISTSCLFAVFRYREKSLVVWLLSLIWRRSFFPLSSFVDAIVHPREIPARLSSLVKNKTYALGMVALLCGLWFARLLTLRLLAPAEQRSLLPTVWVGFAFDLLAVLVLWETCHLISILPAPARVRTYAFHTVRLLAGAVLLILGLASFCYVKFFHMPLDLRALFLVSDVPILRDCIAGLVTVTSATGILLIPLAGMLFFGRSVCTDEDTIPRTGNAWAVAFGVILLIAGACTADDLVRRHAVSSYESNPAIDAIALGTSPGFHGLDRRGHSDYGNYRLPDGKHKSVACKMRPEELVARLPEVFGPAMAFPPEGPNPRLRRTSHFTMEYSADRNLSDLEKQLAGAVGGMGQKPNIVFLVMESWRSCDFLDPDIGANVFPFLTELKERSVFFTNYYSPGFPSGQSERAAIGWCVGANPAPFDPPIFFSRPDLSMRGLPAILADDGYDTICVKGMPEAIHNNGYVFRRLGIREFIDRKDIDAVSARRWSLSNDAVLAGTAKQAERAKQPFFAISLLEATHSPYRPDASLPALPGTLNVTGMSADDRAYLQIFKVADDDLRKFFETAREASWYDNTIFFIFGDHGHNQFPVGKTLDPLCDADRMFRVPLLIYIPGREVRGVVTTTKTHLDLPAGVLQLLDATAEHGFQGGTLFPLDRPTELVVPFADDRIYFVDGNSVTLSAFGQCSRLRICGDRSRFLLDETAPDGVEKAEMPGRIIEKLTLIDFLLNSNQYF